MEENMLKQKIQDAYFEPPAPQELIASVTLRAQALMMGELAQKQLETASDDQIGTLAARALIGQIATVSALPAGVQPEQLAQQLQQEAAFVAALRGGNVLQRIRSGELMQQVAKHRPEKQNNTQTLQKEGPIL